MTTYTAENYDRSVLPGTFKKDLADTIGVAVTLGWKVIVNRKQTVNLISYDGAAGERIGVSNTNRVDVNKLRRTIIRHADPELRAAAADYIETGELATPLGKVPVKAVVKEAAKGITEPEPEPEEESSHGVNEEKPPAHIVSEKPMLASAGSGRGYLSETTIERKWSDGSRDYKCSQCDETSPERLNISRHYANNHSRGKGRGPSPKTFHAEVPDAAAYRPNRYRVAALAAVIAELLEEGITDPEQIAQTALTWVHEQHGSDLSTEAEPMTDSEVLARIRRLLDDGTMGKQERRITALENRLAAADAEAQHQRERAERARATLHALTDLVSEVSSEDDDEEAG